MNVGKLSLFSIGEIKRSSRQWAFGRACREEDGEGCMELACLRWDSHAHEPITSRYMCVR